MAAYLGLYLLQLFLPLALWAAATAVALAVWALDALCLLAACCWTVLQWLANHWRRTAPAVVLLIFLAWIT
ncbi:MAG: hypothetical protein LW862_08975 [Rubrivivax sp.]|jgi:hypothetical protein|nr:hypothetical protein [Rubrivivax sp.]